MKQGQKLQELAQEIVRQAKLKRDFIAPTKKLSMNKNRLEIGGQGEFDTTDVAHRQIAIRLGIPAKYYERMRTEAPGLLANNVNHWFQNNPEQRLVRTLDGKARAFLSNRYRCLDYEDLIEPVLPVLEKRGCRIESSALTETRIYIKAVSGKVQYEIKKGDIVQAGIVISNSEVGLGAVKVEPLMYRLACLNGMIVADSSLSKYHVGRGFETDLAEEFFKDETRKADDKAFWLKVRDVVSGALDKDIFPKIAERLKESTKDEISKDPVKAVEEVREKFNLRDTEKSGVLQHLIKGGDLTRYGLIQAMTQTSQSCDDYDRATELERFGGQVLELPKNQWEEIAVA